MAKEKEYHVQWEIDVSARSHVWAARIALEIQRDVKSTATVFDVHEMDKSEGKRIDLQEVGTPKSLPHVTGKAIQSKQEIITSAETLCEQNISKAITCLREGGWIYEAAALIYLAEACGAASGSNSKCQNCGSIWPDEMLVEAEHLSERVGIGEPMPSGECPDKECGALCQIVPR